MNPTPSILLARVCRKGYCVMTNPGISPEAELRARIAAHIEAHFAKKKGATTAPWCMSHDAPIGSGHALAYGTPCQEETS